MTSNIKSLTWDNNGEGHGYTAYGYRCTIDIHKDSNGYSVVVQEADDYDAIYKINDKLVNNLNDAKSIAEDWHHEHINRNYKCLNRMITECHEWMTNIN